MFLFIRRKVVLTKKDNTIKDDQYKKCINITSKKRLNISGLPRINIKPIEQTIKPIDLGIVQKKSFLTYTFIYLKSFTS